MTVVAGGSPQINGSATPTILMEVLTHTLTVPCREAGFGVKTHGFARDVNIPKQLPTPTHPRPRAPPTCTPPPYRQHHPTGMDPQSPGPGFQVTFLDKTQMSTVVPKFATLKVKSARNAVSDANRPNGSTLAHLLNIYFGTYDVDQHPCLKFKAVPHRKGSKIEYDLDSVAGKPLININECVAITSYASVCEQIQKAHPEIKLSKEELAAITSNTYDGRLRGLLEIAANAVIKPDQPKDKKPKKSDPEQPKEPKEPRKPSDNAFKKHVIPYLGLGFPKQQQTIAEYFKVINDFFSDDDRLRLRCFNLSFPHSVRPSHKGDGEAKGTNLVYLQHISKYHDQVLQNFVDGIDDATILGSIQNEFANSVPRPSLKVRRENKQGFDDVPLDDASFERLKVQLRNADILTNFLTPPNANWVKALTVIKPGKGGKGQVNTDEPLKPYERASIKGLLRELHIVYSFLKLVRAAFESNPDRNVADCFEQYNAHLDDIKGFYKQHKPKSQNYNTFVKYLVESVNFCKDKFGYRLNGVVKGKNGQPDKQVLKSAISAFAVEIKSGLSFKFNKKIREGLDDLVSGAKPLNDDNVIAVANIMQAEWSNLTSAYAVDVSDLDFYSKLGKIVPAAIGKQHKIAVGIAMIQYIFDQIRLIQAKNIGRKGCITVYVHA